MTFTIKLFGPLSRAMGSSQMTVSVEDAPPTCDALRARVPASAPQLAGLLDACRFAVNGHFAAEQQVLNESDEIALIGFVSGG